MTRALAVEWAAFNIQVNAIAPGFIRTDLNRALLDSPEIKPSPKLARRRATWARPPTWSASPSFSPAPPATT